MSGSKGPFRLITVNTAPERAQRLIGRLVDALKEDYEIIHVDNCQSTTSRRYLMSGTDCLLGIDEVLPKVTLHKPDVLVSPSWSLIAMSLRFMLTSGSSLPRCGRPMRRTRFSH
jgi:hypothetical protein